MNAFEAPLISSLLPQYLHLRLEQNRSHAFQSVLDLLSAETGSARYSFIALVARGSLQCTNDGRLEKDKLSKSL